MRYIFNEIYFKIVLKKKKLEVNKIYGSYYPAFVIEYQIESTHLKENKINILWGGGLFKTRFLCVPLAVPELTLCTRLASNSEIYLPLPLKCWDHCPTSFF